MKTPKILFVNLRARIPEAQATLLAAQRLGYEVVLLADKVPDYMLSFIADVEKTNTYDLEQALAAAHRLNKRHKIHAVVTWADRDVELVAQIGQALSLPAPTPAAARLARNKYEMKQALSRLDGVVPRHARICTWTELEAALQTIDFPAVLKPTGAAASRGIFELWRLEDAEAAFKQLQQIATPDFDPIFHYYGAEFILEEFVSGPEFSVEGWIHDGDVLIAGITDKWTTDPFHLEYQHIHPSRFSEADRQEIEAKTALVVTTLGLNNCTFHLEGKLTAQGFRLIEVAARIGGDYITSHLVPLSTGIDFYTQVIRVASGERPIVEPRAGLHAGVRFLLAPAEGYLKGLLGIEAVLAQTAVEHCFLEVKQGHKILLPPHHFVDQRVAAVIARHPHYSQVEETLQASARCCIVDIASSFSSARD